MGKLRRALVASFGASLMLLAPILEAAAQPRPGAWLDPEAAPSPTPSPLPLPAPVRPAPLPTRAPTASTGITSTTALSLDVVPDPAQPVAMPRGAVNIALLGLDTRPALGGASTDAIVIASLNPDPPVVTLLSIPRDVLVYIPGRGMAKVNTAFARGWWTFRQTLQYNFGLRVDYYVKANFRGLVQAVDRLGGITVTALCPIYHVFPSDPYYVPDLENPLVVKESYTNTFGGEVWRPGQLVPTMTINLPRPGVYRLNGLQALAYVRARTNAPNGDLDRGRRFQHVLQALLARAREQGALSLAKLPSLLQQLSSDVETNLGLDQLMALAQFLSARDPVVRMRHFDPIGLTGMTLPEVGFVLVPNRANVRPYLQQAFAVPKNQQALAGVQVEVRDGTGDAGFGRAAIARLRELGFDVIDAGKADRVYSETLVVDRTTTSKGSALPLLRQVGVKEENVRTDPSPDGPRYQITLGQDFEPCYWRAAARQRGQAQPAPLPTPTP